MNDKRNVLRNTKTLWSIYPSTSILESVLKCSHSFSFLKSCHHQSPPYNLHCQSVYRQLFWYVIMHFNINKRFRLSLLLFSIIYRPCIAVNRPNRVAISTQFNNIWKSTALFYSILWKCLMTNQTRRWRSEFSITMPAIYVSVFSQFSQNDWCLW